MTTVIAIKDNKAIFGSPEKVGKEIGLTGEAIRKRIRANESVISKNDYILYLNTEKIR